MKRNFKFSFVALVLAAVMAVSVQVNMLAPAVISINSGKGGAQSSLSAEAVPLSVGSDEAEDSADVSDTVAVLLFPELLHIHLLVRLSSLMQGRYKNHHSSMKNHLYTHAFDQDILFHFHLKQDTRFFSAFRYSLNYRQNSIL